MVALFGPGSCMASTRWPPLRPGGQATQFGCQPLGLGVWVVVCNQGSFLGEGTLSGPGFLVTCPQAFPPLPYLWLPGVGEAAAAAAAAAQALPGGGRGTAKWGSGG